MTYQELATYSNYALYSAMAVLTLSMLAYAGYLAGLMPARSESKEARRAEQVRAREEALVGVGATAVVVQMVVLPALRLPPLSRMPGQGARSTRVSP